MNPPPELPDWTPSEIIAAALIVALALFFYGVIRENLR